MNFPSFHYSCFERERERERDGILFFYTLQCVNKVMGGGGGVEMKV